MVGLHLVECLAAPQPARLNYPIPFLPFFSQPLAFHPIVSLEMSKSLVPYDTLGA